MPDYYCKHRELGRYAEYVAYSNGLTGVYARKAWVEGVDVNGRRCPIAGCWTEADALRYLNERRAERETKET